MRLGALMASASVLPLASAASRAPAQPADNSGKQDKEMLLKADEVEYDTDHSVSTARGHVEIDYAGKIVMAELGFTPENVAARAKRIVKQ